MQKLFEKRKSTLNIPPLENLVEIILWLTFLGLMMTKCFYFQFSTRLNTRPIFNYFNINMLLATFSSILLIVVFTLLISNTYRLVLILCLNILFSLLLFADTIYYRYYYNAISVPVLYQVGLMGSLKDSINSLLRMKDLIFIIDIPVIIAIINLFMRTNNLKTRKIKLSKKLVTSVLIFAVSFGLFRYAYGNSSPGSFPFDNNYVSNSLGVLYFHYYDAKKYIKEHFLTDSKLTEEEHAVIEKFYSGRKTEGENYKGTARGKNLIVLQLEAVQQFVINRKLNGREITPNLNKFINESAYFENFYFQIGGGNTSDAEFLTNTSLYPLNEGAVYFRFPVNTYESTAKILKKQGYTTYVSHANNPSFWNRTEIYKALGFDKFINSTNLSIDEYIGWGLSDKSFFRQTLGKIDTSKPFYGFFITLSSHYPFNFFEDYHGFNVGKYEDTFIGNYIKSVSYVDEAIGEFFNDLKQRGLYDNSVIVIYGDHSAIPKDQSDVLKDIIGYTKNNFNWLMLQRTPCFIRFPGMDKTGAQKVTGGEIDILPTIANLMGFEAPHSLGKDLFNTKKGYAVLRNSSVITDDFAYSNADGKVYDLTGNVIIGNKYTEIIRQYQNQLEISDLIIRKNALKP